MANLPSANILLKEVAATNINIQQGKQLALDLCN